MAWQFIDHPLITIELIREGKKELLSQLYIISSSRARFLADFANNKLVGAAAEIFTIVSDKGVKGSSI